MNTNLNSQEILKEMIVAFYQGKPFKTQSAYKAFCWNKSIQECIQEMKAFESRNGKYKALLNAVMKQVDNFLFSVHNMANGKAHYPLSSSVEYSFRFDEKVNRWRIEVIGMTKSDEIKPLLSVVAHDKYALANVIYALKESSVDNETNEWHEAIIPKESRKYLFRDLRETIRSF